MNMSRSAAGNPTAGPKNARPLPARDLSRSRPVRCRLLRRLRRDERGVALAELALVLPVLLLLMLGMIDFGKAINYWIDQTHLANEGARLAAVNKNPASKLPCSSAAGSTLQDYILRLTETVEQRGCAQGTQRSTHAATVAICFYAATTGASTTTPIVGDTVEVLVRYDYNWLRGFPFPGDPSTTITGKAAMRLEAAPTTYNTAGNTGTCPASA
jgi:Flp pilus assembly pilin Flp